MEDSIPTPVKPSKSLIEIHYGVSKEQITKSMISEFFKIQDAARLSRGRMQNDEHRRMLANSKTLNENKIFEQACLIAGIRPTKRQASKWNASRGKAWSFRSKAKRALGLGQAVVS